MTNQLPPEAAAIIGAKPQGKMMNAREAVATMSHGFLKIMEFMHAEVGVKTDAMMMAMKEGQRYGLCVATNGINRQGKPFVHYVNPYQDWLKPEPAPLLATDTPTEGAA